MKTQNEKANNFNSLHKKGNPVVLYNIWDAGSAKIVEKSGAKAIATGSAAVARAHGYSDGENLPLKLVLANLSLIVKAVDLPVSIDIESGYGLTPNEVSNAIVQAIDCGAVGFNIEDQHIAKDCLFEAKEQAKRIEACRKSVDASGVNAFINVRTDVFLRAGKNDKIEDLLEKVKERAKVYHQAGASGLFVPKLIDVVGIKELCETSPLPINILKLPNCPDIRKLTELGVSRISYGQEPYVKAMEMINKEAQEIYA